jgi:hypothetical protein
MTSGAAAASKRPKTMLTERSMKFNWMMRCGRPTKPAKRLHTRIWVRLRTAFVICWQKLREKLPNLPSRTFPKLAEWSHTTVVQRVPYPEGDLILPTGIELTDPVSLDEQTAQSALLRDIFGNPFRPVAFNPAWRTDTAVSLARTMYESREFGAMPILADALQDAGCEDEQILNHCRDANQPHVRGCWVCDLVLGL